MLKKATTKKARLRKPKAKASTITRRQSGMLAEREIELVRSDGRVTKVVLGIGLPAHQPGGEWACEVSARGLYDRLAPQRGIDAFQSVILAITLLRTLITGELDRGSTVRSLGDHSTLGSLFGGVGEARGA